MPCPTRRSASCLAFPTASALALATALSLLGALPSRAAAVPLASVAPHAAAPRIASIAIPGDPRFVAIARDVLAVQAAYMPDFAAQSGLIDDAMQVPSFSPERVAAWTRRIRADLAALRALPWRQWDVDAQIDLRWVYANAERIERELTVERLYLHRPGAWLESLANTYIAILTYAPQRTDALDRLTAQVPALVAEMSAICQPTQADIDTAQGLLDGMESMLKSQQPAGAGEALAALAAYRHRLAQVQQAPGFAVVGPQNYAWRLARANLLPWTPEALLTLAQQRLAQVDGEITALSPKIAPPGPLPAEWQAAAATLDQASLLALYDRIQSLNRAAIEKAGFVTIPAGVGPVKARVTPDAMVPLTGDGGSMNPPPPFGAPDNNTGWWNVEHFDPRMPQAQRERVVRGAALYQETGMGPYAVHEGLPGHHLQLAIARLNPNPLRNLFQDPVQNEGWALYAEQLMWEQGGLGDTVAAQVNTLRSWRGRIRRVVYDVNIETGRWTLQQGADWRENLPAGQAEVGPEIKRAINWPAQLICYFAGKEQILALKADYQRKWGPAYAERRFHDELLALGSVPYVFARAKLLGEPVPGL